MSLIYDVSFDSTTRVLSLLDKAGNVISSCEVPSKDVDDITKPLTFKATQDGSTVKLKKSGSPSGAFQTSRDGGNTWTDYTLDTAITLNIGDEVSFRAKTNRTSKQSREAYFHFEMTGKIEAWHNVMSLYRTNDFATYNTMVESSFRQLFSGCTSLTKAPILPATTLAKDCYEFMFSGCRSLTKAPELPATKLVYGCYSCMFQGCQSLTKAPELPATTLADYCYYYMFDYCASLTKAPELPATTLAAYCYEFMFFGCHSLKEVRIAATTTAENALFNWLNNVSATGDFYCNPNATIFPTGTSGIPSGWRRLSINEEAPTVDDLTKPLTFKATQDGSTVLLKKKGSPSGSFQTSRDGGNTWEDYTIDTAIPLNTGDEVSFRAKANRTSVQNAVNFFYFSMEGKIEAWHNVMSLYRTNDFAMHKNAGKYAFYRMFSGCQSLTKAPILPATRLNEFCYEFMFSGCQSLTKAPELPATTLADLCYDRMFQNCQSLKEVRVSATTTAKNALTNWLSGVSATGDFYCNPNATIFPTGESGIPANWRRLNINDYPTT